MGFAQKPTLKKNVFDTNEIVLRIYFSAIVLIFHVILHKWKVIRIKGSTKVSW